MKTVSIQIGNSDDKLTQRQWAHYCQDVQGAVARWCGEIHFSGHSIGGQPWQNACWVAELRAEYGDDFKKDLTEIRKRYLQDSIAWLDGDSKFI